MQTVNQALQLLKRQVEIENAMRRPGGIRITEEQELHGLRLQLQQFPEAMQAVIGTARALRRSVTDLSAQEVETWAATGQAG
jgi:hypothetical protein